MKYFLFFIALFSLQSGYSQQLFPTINKNEEYQPPKDEIQLNEAVIVSTRLFANDTARYQYNQMKHYVKMVLPYVDIAVKMFGDIEDATKEMSKKSRRKYIRSKEKEIKVNFEDKLASLNVTQGRLLVKLINRQLDVNCYHILKELKNPITATYYLSVARLNGINLNEHYKPEENKDLELVMRNLGYRKEIE